MSSAGRWQRVVVTGAASGIGRAFAEELGRRGAALGLVDVAAGGIERLAGELRAGAIRVEGIVADVGDAAAMDGAAATVQAALGGVDLVVHCAAVLGPGEFSGLAAADFERVVRVNLLGTANVLRAFRPGLRQTRGVIACLASTAAVHGWPLLGAYSAAKFGVVGLCDAVRPELAREGVHLLSVFPLLIDTPLLAAAGTPPVLRQGKRLPPAVVVERTLAAAAARRARVFIPATVRLVAALHGLAPSLLDWYGQRIGFES